MGSQESRGQKLVDLARYRAAHKRVPLPLFDAGTRPPLALVEPFPSLSLRQVEHRARMLAHLAAGGAGFSRP